MSTPEPPQDPLDALAAEEEAVKAANAAAEPAPDGEQPQSGEALEAPPEEQQPEWMTDPRFGGDPAKLWASYKESEKKIGQQGQELGELRQFRQQAEPLLFQQQQPQQGGGEFFPDGTPIYDAGTLKAMVDNGDLDEFTANMVWADQQAKVHAMGFAQAMQEQFDQTLQPLKAAYVDTASRNSLDELNAVLGDDVVARHGPLLAELFKSDRAHYSDPTHGARRLKEAVIAAEFESRMSGGASQPRAANGQFQARDTYVEGGSGAHPMPGGGTQQGDPADRELIESLVTPPNVDEMGIKIPWA